MYILRQLVTELVLFQVFALDKALDVTSSQAVDGQQRPRPHLGELSAVNELPKPDLLAAH